MYPLKLEDGRKQKGKMEEVKEDGGGTTEAWLVHKYIQKCLCDTKIAKLHEENRGGERRGGGVVAVSVGGSHALIPLRANMKRVNNTRESVCAPALVNGIHFCFQ